VRGKAVFIKGKETARGIAVSSILRVPFTGKLDFSKAKA
jgi:hypothetical protein